MLRVTASVLQLILPEPQAVGPFLQNIEMRVNYLSNHGICQARIVFSYLVFSLEAY